MIPQQHRQPEDDETLYFMLICPLDSLMDSSDPSKTTWASEDDRTLYFMLKWPLDALIFDTHSLKLPEKVRVGL